MSHDLTKRTSFVGRKLYFDSGIISAAFVILSCILSRKIDSVLVNGFGAAIGLGMSGAIWAWAKDAGTETETKPQRTMNRATARSVQNRLSGESSIRTSSFPGKYARKVPLGALRATSLLSINKAMDEDRGLVANCSFSTKAVRERAKLWPKPRKERVDNF